MSHDALGMSRCSHCGAEYRLFTIFNKDMQGLCKAWKGRHEFACAKKTPEQRLKWAKPYIGKDRHEISIVVDLNHPGFSMSQKFTLPIDNYDNVDLWYEALVKIAKSHNNASAVRDFNGWTGEWENSLPKDVYYAEFPEHKNAEPKN